MIDEWIRYRLSGRASVDRYRRSQRRLALSAQEVIAVAAFLGLGLAMTLSPGGIGNPEFHEAFADIGGTTPWGLLFLLIAIPQVVGIGLGYTGYIELTMGHYPRIFALALTTAAFVFTGAIWISIGSLWAGGGWCLLFAGTAAAAARHVHLFNGRSDHAVHLEPEVSDALSRRGYQFGHD